MSPEILAAIAASSAFAGMVGALISGLFNKKRLGADAAAIITTAASGVVEMLHRESKAKDARVAALEKKEAALERRIGELETTLAYEHSAQQSVNQMHAAWDFLAYEEIRSTGNKSNLPTPPPLYPPPASRVAPRV